MTTPMHLVRTWALQILINNSSSDGEVWEIVESEEDSEQMMGAGSPVSETILGISFFLAFFTWLISSLSVPLQISLALLDFYCIT